MAYIDPFLAHGFSFPQKDQEILNKWYEEEKERTAWAIPKLLPFEEAMKYRDFCAWFDGFPGGQALVLWNAEYMSAVGGYYYTGLLKGTVFLQEHDSTDVGYSPQFLSLERFYDYYQRILQEYTEDGEDPNLEDSYEGKFWHYIDYNDNQPLKEEETVRFHFAAQELLKVWKSGNLKQNWYEDVGYCAVTAMPDCYAAELIPYLKPERKDEYVLAVICDKLARAHCTQAIDAMRVLWEAEQKGFRVGGRTSPGVVRAALRRLNLSE